MVQPSLQRLRHLTRSSILSGAAILAVLVFSSVAPTARAETAAEPAMNRVCQNWLTAMVHEQGNWAGSVTPRVKDTQTLHASDTALGLLYTIEPSGFVLVPFLKALPPIMAYADEGEPDVRDSMGLIQLFRDMLRMRNATYVAKYGSLAAALPTTAGVQEESQWGVYTLDDQTFATRLESMQPMTGGDILLGANYWSQGYPWNLYCPSDACSSSPAGCSAISAAQIMRYWQWPPQGNGSHCYFWQGEVNSDTLCASFDDPYDWSNMPLSSYGGFTGAQASALAELAYEVGVALDMNYHCQGSSGPVGTSMWSDYFYYDPSAHIEYRSNYTAQQWFNMIVNECEAHRPMQFAISPLGHALVCDGWRVFSGNQVHMNYGWANTYNAWYFIDSIAGSDPTYEYMFMGIKPIASSFPVHLTIQSTNPGSGVGITVVPPDTNLQGNGITPFVRDYTSGQLVTLQAPPIANGNSFAKWQRDGLDLPAGATATVSLYVGHAVTALYLSCTETAPQPSVNPQSPFCVNTPYCLAWSRVPGAVSYEIRENGGTSESTGTDTSKCYGKATGGSYSYEVRTVSACGTGVESPASIVIVESATPATPGQPWVDPPSPVCVNTDYIVRWDAVPGATSYEIRENGGTWQNLGLVTEFYCLKTTAGGYTYEVRALNSCGVSAPGPSVMMTVTTHGAAPAVPGQPTVTPASPVCVYRQYTVHWDPVPGAAYYEIRENAGAWHSCGAVTMWGVIKYTPGVISYQVRASNGCGQSLPSSALNVTVGKCFDVIINSSYPIDGVPIVVNPLDQDGMGNASTPFARNYSAGTTVSLTAPATFSGAPFLKWLRDGVHYSGAFATIINVDTVRNMTASYGVCDCPRQGDIDGSGYIDVQDVLAVIRVAFSNGADISDLSCANTRSDANGDGVADVNDVLYMIRTAFVNGPNPVNPCGT